MKSIANQRRAFAVLAASVIAAAAAAWNSGQDWTDPPASVEAVAAAAWAQLHCNVDVRVGANAPRLTRDDLLGLSGAHDAEATKHGLKVACDRAIKRSRSVGLPVEAMSQPDHAISAMAFSR